MLLLVRVLVVLGVLVGAAVATDDLTIALLYSNIAPNSARAMEVAISEVNQQDQVLPETLLKGIAVSTGLEAQSSPAKTTTQLCNILRESKVAGIIGPFDSSHVRESAYLTSLIKMPLIAPTAADPYIEYGNWTASLYRLSPSNQVQAVAMADLVKHFGWERISIVYTDDAYGLTMRKFLKSELQVREVDVLADIRIKYTFNTTLVRELKGATGPKAWIKELLSKSTRVTVLLMPPAFAEVVLEAAAENSMIDSMYVWLATTPITQSFGNVYTTEGRIKGYYDGMLGLSPSLVLPDNKLARLDREYSKNGQRLTPVDVLVYEAVHFLASSMDGVYRSPTFPSEGITNYPGNCSTTELDWPMGERVYSQFEKKSVKTLSYDVVSFNRHLNASDTISKVGEWSEEGGLKISREPIWTHGSRDLPADKPTITEVKLRLGVLEDPPFIMYNYTRGRIKYSNCSAMENKEWCYTGISIDIIRHLQSKLNFDYEFIEPADGKFGNEVNGQWNGLIKEINEKRMDIGIVGFGTSHSREQAVNFGITIHPGGIRMATTRDVSVNDFFFFLKPFSFGVWASICGGIVLFFLAFFSFDRISPYGNYGGVNVKAKLCQCLKCENLLKKGFRDHWCPFQEDNELKHQMAIMNAPNSLWLSVCSFLAVAPADGIPKNWSGRLVLTVWWMVCLVLVSMYTANLAAFLTVSNEGVDISSAEDLVQQDDYTFGTIEGSITENLLQNSDDANLRLIYSRSNSTSSLREATTRMKIGSYIFMYGVGPLEKILSENCDLELIGDVLVDFGYAFAYQIGSPYIEDFNREMLVMQEKGMIKDFWDSYVNAHCEEGGFDAEADSLQIASLLGILYICIPGLVLAGVVFALEIVFSPKSRNGKRTKILDAVEAVFDDNVIPAGPPSEYTAMEKQRETGTYEVPAIADSLEYVSPELDQTLSSQMESIFLAPSHGGGPRATNGYCTDHSEENGVRHVELVSDASYTGWGGVNLSNGRSVRGYWEEKECRLPSLERELKAVYFLLKSFYKHEQCSPTDVTLYLDNQEAVNLINRVKPPTDFNASAASVSVARTLKLKIWEVAKRYELALTAVYYTGPRNSMAEVQSHQMPDTTDWLLPTRIFDRICDHFNVAPDIDLFASYHSYKCAVFVSRAEDPKSFKVDAFSLPWDSWDTVYCFPPFDSDQLLLRVARKISRSSCTVLLVIPWRKRARWFAEVQALATGPPLQLGSNVALRHPHDTTKVHPLQGAEGGGLQLAAVLCQSGSRKKGGFVPEITDTSLMGGNGNTTGPLSEGPLPSGLQFGS